MADAVLGKAAVELGRLSFHFWMTLLMALFVFGGFGMTYLGPLALGTFPHAPPVVDLHGIILFSWTLLLVVQSALVNVRNVRLHRSLGTFGIALGTAVFLVATLIAILSFTGTEQNPDDPGLGYLTAVAPPSFAIIFAMAIRAVRTPAVHRNLILLAMISILMPGINRFYMMGLGLTRVPFYPTYLTMDAMLTAILWQERRATGGVSRMTWIATVIIVVPQLLLPLIAPTVGFLDFRKYLGALVYYR